MTLQQNVMSTRLTYLQNILLSCVPALWIGNFKRRTSCNSRQLESSTGLLKQMSSNLLSPKVAIQSKWSSRLWLTNGLYITRTTGKTNIIYLIAVQCYSQNWTLSKPVTKSNLYLATNLDSGKNMQPSSKYTRFYPKSNKNWKKKITALMQSIMSGKRLIKFGFKLTVHDQKEFIGTTYVEKRHA